MKIRRQTDEGGGDFFITTTRPNSSTPKFHIIIFKNKNSGVIKIIYGVV